MQVQGLLATVLTRIKNCMRLEMEMIQDQELLASVANELYQFSSQVSFKSKF